MSRRWAIGLAGGCLALVALLLLPSFCGRPATGRAPTTPVHDADRDDPKERPPRAAPQRAEPKPDEVSLPGGTACHQEVTVKDESGARVSDLAVVLVLESDVSHPLTATTNGIGRATFEFPCGEATGTFSAGGAVLAKDVALTSNHALTLMVEEAPRVFVRLLSETGEPVSGTVTTTGSSVVVPKQGGWVDVPRGSAIEATADGFARTLADPPEPGYPEVDIVLSPGELLTLTVEGAVGPVAVRCAGLTGPGAAGTELCTGMNSGDGPSVWECGCHPETDRFAVTFNGSSWFAVSRVGVDTSIPSPTFVPLKVLGDGGCAGHDEYALVVRDARLAAYYGRLAKVQSGEGDVLVSVPSETPLAVHCETGDGETVATGRYNSTDLSVIRVRDLEPGRP